jgi:hypothetical protein
MANNITAAAAQSTLADFVGLIASGAGTAVCEIYTSGHATLLVSFDLAATPMGTPTTPTVPGPSISTATGLPGTPIAGTAVATGTAAAYRIKDKDGTVVVYGDGSDAVNTSAAVAILNTLSIESGQTVNLNDLKLTFPTVVTVYAIP